MKEAVRSTKKTGWFLKAFLLGYVVCRLVMENALSGASLAVLLAITAINIYREKYNSGLLVTGVGLLCVCIGAWLNPDLGSLFCLPVLDFSASDRNYLTLAPVIGELYFFHDSGDLPVLLLLTVIVGLFGYTLSIMLKRESELKEAFDRERRMRYELETAKAKLLSFSKEAAHLAEEQERNRLAREIHDSVGHRTSAVLIQLQAAYRLFDRDVSKAKETVGICVGALSETMELLRNTVHNIKPEQRLGAAYIQNILDNFTFCPVRFKFDGDFGTLPPNVLEILGANLMEALTNVQKHTHAASVDIRMDINENYTRLYIKDDGDPCPSFHEGMGLGGMRERIENIGGTMSVNADDGFCIVCIIPS